MDEIPNASWILKQRKAKESEIQLSSTTHQNPLFPSFSTKTMITLACKVMLILLLLSFDLKNSSLLFLSDNPLTWEFHGVVVEEETMISFKTHLNSSLLQTHLLFSLLLLHPKVPHQVTFLQEEMVRILHPPHFLHHYRHHHLLTHITTSFLVGMLIVGN